MRLRWFPSFLAFFVLFCSSPGQVSDANTVVRRFPVAVAVKGASMWTDGAPRSGIGPYSLFPDWNVPRQTVGSISEIKTPAISIPELGIFIPEVNVGKIGATATFDSSGGIGFRMYAGFSGGTVDFDYLGDLVVSFPRQIQPFTQVPVTVSFQPRGGSFLKSASPEFTLGMDAYMNFKSRLDMEVWLFGSEPLYRETAFDVNETEVRPMVNAYNFLTPFLGFGSLALPVGVQIYKPTINVNRSTVNTDGSLTATAFSRFMSIDANLVFLLSTFLGPAGKVSTILSKDIPIPGTDMRIAWDIAKFYGRFDLGYRQDFRLSTAPRFVLTATDSSGSIQTRQIFSGQTATFSMPANGSITLSPSVSLNPSLKNDLYFALGGSLGYTPFRLALQGIVGRGSGRSTFDFDVSPGKIEHVFSPNNGSLIESHTVNIPAAAVTTPPIVINALNDTGRPNGTDYGGYAWRSSFFSQGLVPAFNGFAKENFEDIDVLRVKFFPGAGSVFPNVAIGQVTLPDEATQNSEIRLLSYKGGLGSELILGVPLRRLVPGIHNIRLVAQTASGPLPFDVVMPVNANRPTFVSGYAYRTQGQSSDSQNKVGSIQWDGQSAVQFYIDTDFTHPDTQVRVNDTEVVPATKVNGQHTAPTGNGEFLVTIPADVMRKYVGTIMRIGLSQTDLSTTDARLISANTVPIAVLPPTPRVTDVTIDGQPLSNIAQDDRERTVVVTGTGFVPSTGVMLTLRDFQFPSTQPIFEFPEVEVVNSNLMRFRIPAETMTRWQRESRFVLRVRAVTPVVDFQTPQGQVASGGGLSPEQFSSSMGSATPFLGDLDEPIVPIGQTVTVVLRGGFFKNYTRANGTIRERATVIFNGQTLPSAAVTFSNPVGNYSDTATFVVRGDSAAMASERVNTIQISNGDTVSQVLNLSVIAPRPGLGQPSPARIRVTPGQSPSVAVTVANRALNAVFRFAGTEVVARETTNPNTVRLILPNALLSATPGASAPITVENPGSVAGPSEPVMLGLDEGDLSTLAFTRGPLTFSRATGLFAQTLTLRYKGTRLLSGAIRATLTGLPTSVKLENRDGESPSGPYRDISVNLTPNGTTSIVLQFRRTASVAINYSISASFTN
jgi:hypothetical protein